MKQCYHNYQFKSVWWSPAAPRVGVDFVQVLLQQQQCSAAPHTPVLVVILPAEVDVAHRVHLLAHLESLLDNCRFGSATQDVQRQDEQLEVLENALHAWLVVIRQSTAVDPKRECCHSSFFCHILDVLQQCIGKTMNVRHCRLAAGWEAQKHNAAMCTDKLWALRRHYSYSSDTAPL